MKPHQEIQLLFVKVFKSIALIIVFWYIPEFVNAQAISFSSSNTSVPSTNLSIPSNTQPIYRAVVTASSGGANFSNLTFTPTGTFVPADIINYNVYEGTTDNLTNAGKISDDNNGTPLASGIQMSIPINTPYFSNNTYYVWITANISSSATSGHTLTVGALTINDFTFSGGTVSKSGIMYVGGTQVLGASSPIIILNPGSLSGFSYTGAGPSTSQTYTVSGSHLTGNITITAPAHYEISTSSGSGYAGSLSLSSTGGTVYVRLKSGLSPGPYNSELITHTSTNAATANLTCNGTVNPSPPTVTTPVTYCQNSAASPLTATGTGLLWAVATGTNGSVGGTNAGTSDQYADNTANNWALQFTTNVANVTLTSVDMYSGTSFSTTSCTIGIYNSSGVLLTSTPLNIPQTTQNIKYTITFNYLLAAADDYTIRLSTGNGHFGNISLASTTSGSVNITGDYLYWSGGGTTTKNIYNNLQFSYNSYSSTAPTPSTTTIGTTNYLVTQTVSGITSAPATIEVDIVNTATTIASQSTAAQTQCIGIALLPITVTAAGVNLTYQWYSNTTASNSGGTNLGSANGAETNSYTPQSAVAGKLYYYCVVIGCTSATSAVSGAFTVNPATAITTNPSTTAQTQCINGTFSALSVVATGTGTLTYQWYSNTTASNTSGTLISSATASSYTPLASTAGTLYYYCIVTGTCTTATSAVSGAFTVNAATMISSQSTAAQTQCLNGVFTAISVTATGTGTLTYQWYRNATANNTGGTSILGATASSYTPLASTAGTLYYYCIVTGTCATATSSVSGAFTVNQSPVITAMTYPVSSGVPFTITPVNSTNGIVPAGTTYTWSAPAGNFFTGGVVSSGSSITGTLTLNPGTTTATAIYTVTPTSGSNCPGSTFTVTVTITPNYWQGTSASTDWSQGANWAGNSVPSSGSDVVFASTPNNDLVLDGTRTIGNLTNTSSKRLFISTGKCLTINGTVNTNSDPTKIYIQSGSSVASGSLIFISTSPVYATVEMYSQASKGTGITVGSTTYFYSWQYFGIPLNSVLASPTFDGSFVRSYNETSTVTNGKWTQLANWSVLSPFAGYEITQTSPKTIIYSGILVNSSNTIQLTNTSGAYDPGQNIISNPYTAAIDIRQLIFGPNTEQTIYLFNTGSFGQWSNNTGEGTYNTDPSLALPGQYLAIPKNNAGTGTYPHNIPYDIPSMSGFLVRDTISGANGSITINYNTTVISQNVNPQRAPSQLKQASDKVYLEITLKGKRTGDCMWLINQPGTTRGFDNGWDGYKLSGTLGTPQLFAMEDSGNYQVSTSSDMSNTYLGFQAGLDLEDTLTFYSENLLTQYAGIYLEDLIANKVIDISTSGTQYAFVTDSTAAPVKRFMIVTNPTVTPVTSTQLKVFNSGNTVFIQNSGPMNGELIVYDMMGRDIRRATFGQYGITAVKLETISGAYIIKATTDNESVSKKIIF